MKQSVAIIFSLVLLHYTAHGAPNIFSSILTTSTNYINGKINKSAEAIGQVISLTTGTTQLATSLTSSAAYMGTTTGKAGLSSITTFGKEIISGIVKLVDNELEYVSNLTDSIPVVGQPIGLVTGIGRSILDLVNSVGQHVLTLTESFGNAPLTATNTVIQLTTGAIGGAAHGGAALGKVVQRYTVTPSSLPTIRGSNLVYPNSQNDPATLNDLVSLAIWNPLERNGLERSIYPRQFGYPPMPYYLYPTPSHPIILSLGPVDAGTSLPSLGAPVLKLISYPPFGNGLGQPSPYISPETTGQLPIGYYIPVFTTTTAQIEEVM